MNDVQQLFSILGNQGKKRKPYFTKIKRIKNGIATLSNGVKVKIKKSEAKTGDSVVVMQGRINPIGILQ